MREYFRILALAFLLASAFGDNIFVENYSFNKATKQITFSDYITINLEKISEITNLTQGKVLYKSGDPSLGGTVSGNVLTLRFNTNDALFSNADKLQIKYSEKAAPVTQAVTGTFWQSTQPVSLATVPLPTGAATSSLQTTANNSLSTITSTISRSNAGSDTASGNTHQTIGGTDGTNLKPLLTDDLGRAVVKRGSRFQFRSTVTLTGTTETTLIASVASIRHCIQFLIICNNSTTDRVTLSLRDSTSGTIIPLGGFEPNASGKMPAIPFHFPVALEQTTANNNWTIQATGTSPDVTIVAISERVN